MSTIFRSRSARYPRTVSCQKCSTLFTVAILAASSLLNMATESRVEAGIAGLELVTSALDAPVYATYAPGDTDRLFIVERGGNIRILDLATGQLNVDPFLQTPDADTAGEGGLLGLAFHPDYQTNGKFYTYTTVDNGGILLDGQVSPFSSRVRGYTVSANPNIANSAPQEIVSWVQPRNNHNGGWIGFSPLDNYLYITSGDGGKGGDPDNNAQTLDENNPGQTFSGEPLGKILRLDIDGDDFPADADRNYAIPASNPFVGNPNANDEIWASGLRNPWRASFDRANGDFWIGDVGQGTREEINRQLGTSPGGENYGWQRREGTVSHQGGASLPGDTEPVYDYITGTSGDFQGRAVVGGIVYRGPDPSLQGTYFFADTITSNFWTFDIDNPTATVANINSDLSTSVGFPVAFAEDAVGNLYVVDLGGSLYRIQTDLLVDGDFDASGLVDGQDLGDWEAGFGAVAGAVFADGDADGDEDVDGADFLVWQQNAGSSSQDPPLGAAAVPEPSSIGLALGACLVLARRRRR